MGSIRIEKRTMNLNSLREKLTGRKNVYLLFGSLVLIILFLALAKSKTKPESEPLISPTPSIKLSPAPAKITTTPTSSVREQFKLITINPPAGKHEIGFSAYPIKFTFNQEIEEKSIKVDSNFSRQIIVKLEENKKIIALYPKVGWDLDKSQKINLTGITSISGEKIEKPIYYEFKLVFPTISPENYWSEEGLNL